MKKVIIALAVLGVLGFVAVNLPVSNNGNLAQVQNSFNLGEKGLTISSGPVKVEYPDRTEIILEVALTSGADKTLMLENDWAINYDGESVSVKDMVSAKINDKATITLEEKSSGKRSAKIE